MEKKVLMVLIMLVIGCNRSPITEKSHIAPTNLNKSNDDIVDKISGHQWKYDKTIPKNVPQECQWAIVEGVWHRAPDKFETQMVGRSIWFHAVFKERSKSNSLYVIMWDGDGYYGHTFLDAHGDWPKFVEDDKIKISGVVKMGPRINITKIEKFK